MNKLTPSQEAMLALFQQHVNAELKGDIETTMATMTDHPHLTNVPLITGGVGREGVREFYANHLVGKFFPPDVEMINVSRTVGDDQIVVETASSSAPTYPAGIRFAIASSSSFGALPESMKPGEMALTVMP